MEVGEERGRRALGRMGVAALGLLAVGVFYLRPSLTALSTAPARVATPIEPTIGSVSFGDAQRGAVQVLGTNPSHPRTYITEDGGRTWKPMSDSKSSLTTAVFLDRRTLLVQEVRPDGRPSLRTSQDGGRTWRTLNDPRTGDIAPGRVTPVGQGPPTFMDARNGWLVERSFPDRGPQAAVGLWRTRDGGVTWQRLRAAGMQVTGFPLDPVFVDGMHGALSLAMPPPARSILTTSDGGDTWRLIEVPDLALVGTEVTRTIVLKHGQRLLAVLLALPTRAVTDRFIVGEPGVVSMSLFVSVSDDGGQTWSRPRAGPDVVGAYVGAIPQLDDRGRLLLLDGRRLWISIDDGATWTALVVQAPAGLSPYTVVAAVPGALYAAARAPAATDTVGASFRLTLLRSTDGGAHWSAVSLPRPTQT